MGGSDPIRDWGSGLLLLGAIVLVFAIGLAAAQVLVAQVSERNVGFLALAPGGLVLAAILMAAGFVLRASVSRRGSRKEPF